MPQRTKTSEGFETGDDTVQKAQTLTDSASSEFTPISPAQVTDTQTPFQIEEPLPATEAPALEGELETRADQFTQDLEKEAKVAGEEKESSLEALLRSELGTQGETELKARAFASEGGVDEITRELNIINQDILVEQNALRRQIEAIDERGGGLKGGAVAEKENLRRVSLAKQADLSIIQMGIQGRFNSAKTIADRAVQVQLEQDKQKNAILNTIYLDNKEQFTLAEQRAFDSAQGDRERTLNEKEADAQALSDAKLNAMKMASLNKAPPEVMRAIGQAKTPEEVINAGGQFGAVDLLDREAKQASIRASRASAALNEQKLLDVAAKDQAIKDAVESGQIVLSEDQADRASKISKEFEGEAGEFKKVVASYNRILSAAEDDSAAGDVAVVFNFMKMLDPGSVVRESEFALAASTGSLKEAIQNKFGRVATGEILEFTRDDFVNTAAGQYNIALDQQIELEDRFRTQATDLFGLPENAADLIVQDIRAVGAVSDAAFNLTINEASDEQLNILKEQGLLPNSTPNTI